MRTWSLVLLGIAACGSIHSDPQPARPPAVEPAQASAPPGGSPDPWPSTEPTASSDASDAPEPAGSEPRPAPAPGKPPQPAKPPPPPGLPADAQALLDAHNRVRAKHCAPALSWSPKLAQVAQQWASSLRDQGCKLGHSGGRYGENLAAGTSGVLDGQSVTDMWYDEVKQYSFRKGGFSMQTGHFTQVVWRQTTQVGCGMTTCRGMDIWVCEYDPPGNFEGMYRENVLPTGCR